MGDGQGIRDVTGWDSPWRATGARHKSEPPWDGKKGCQELHWSPASCSMGTALRWYKDSLGKPSSLLCLAQHAAPFTLECGGLASQTHWVSPVMCVLHIPNHSIVSTMGRIQGLAEAVAAFMGVINHHQNQAYCYCTFRITARRTGTWHKSVVNCCLIKLRERISKASSKST